MRSLKALPLLIISLFCTPAFAESPASFKGQASFVSDAPVEKINGISKASGEITMDLKDLSGIHGVVKVPVSSMKTGNEKRDDHMYSPMWLDAARCPEVSFSFKGAEVMGSKTKGEVTATQLKVKGEFSLHCVKKEMETIVEVKTKGALAKVTSSFEVALKDFEVKGKEGVVGSKVGNTIAVNVTLKGRLPKANGESSKAEK
jgi:polyisoprenoid-binding protein YceI